MIRYVQYKDIDRLQWDACIDRAVNGMPYAYAWYLDIVAEKHWNALVLDAYQAVFPVPVTKKFFIKKAYQPFFTQQLGLFYHRAEDAQLLTEFLQELDKHFRTWRVQCNTGNDLSGVLYPVHRRVTHHVDLSGSYPDLEKAYSTQIKRNLKRAQEYPFQIVELHSSELLIQLRKKHLAHVIRQGRQKAEDTLRLGKLIDAALQRGKGRVLSVAGPGGDVQSAVFLLNSNGKLMYLSAVSTETGKKMQAMTFLIDHIFQTYAASGLTFDFEGSMVPGLARYYKGFGGMEVPYWVVYNP